MSNDLKTLVQNREALLLAEAAAWLHDYRKCSEEQLQVQAANSSPKAQGLARNELTNRFNGLSSLSVNLSVTTETLPNLLNQWKGKSGKSHASLLLQYISRCHNTAHFDKQDPDNSSKQNYPGMQISTAFGFETNVGVHLTSKLWRLPWNTLTSYNITDRADLRSDLGDLFSTVGADTRRPINEISLWDWGHTVGAFYKSALAGALLGFQPQANDLRWRLLSVRFDGLAYFTEGHRLPDLLARRKLLGDALDNVRELLEVTYPLGTEVYRDENGSVFVVPGCKKGNCKLDVLALADKGKSLHQLILDHIQQAIEGEIVPRIKMDEDPWCGQDPQRQSNDELPPVAKHLSPAATHSNPDWVAKQWQGRSDDICTVCGLRPQGPSSKSQDRGVCDICEQRRADRSEKWATQNLNTTIWTDEVSDTNGRLTLIMGQFDLTSWLDGSLVQTLTVVDPANASSKTADDVAKNPSFARIRRVWETTRRFWQQIRDGFSRTVGSAGPRLKIIPQGRDELDLGNFHTYELVLSGDIRLSVVWDSDEHRFITCDNLDYLAKPDQLGRPVQDVLTQGQTLTIEEPIGYGGENKVWGEITLAENAQGLPGEYTPAIPILAEPRTFMALVPADKALDVIQDIQQKYEREMGKVRNRLPLHLGAVYFHRRTPLRAALDTGRRMLAFTSTANDGWKVTKVVECAKDAAPDHLQDAQFACWREVTLQRAGPTITWRVPLRMGDGKKKDVWYPYVFLATDDEPPDPARHFQAPNPWSADDDWLVHAGDLKQDDVVYFTPATFDFEHLDTTARRFEVSYKAGQRRGDAKAQRPYLLDDLARIEDVWQTLYDGLSTSQIKALETLIETKRRDWKKHKGAQALALPDEDPFRQLCRDALANAEWRGTTWQNIPKAKREQLVRAAVSGMLADAIELHLTIAKEEIEPKHKETI